MFYINKDKDNVKKSNGELYLPMYNSYQTNTAFNLNISSVCLLLHYGTRSYIENSTFPHIEVIVPNEQTFIWDTNHPIVQNYIHIFTKQTSVYINNIIKYTVYPDLLTIFNIPIKNQYIDSCGKCRGLWVELNNLIVRVAVEPLPPLNIPVVLNTDPLFLETKYYNSDVIAQFYNLSSQNSKVIVSQYLWNKQIYMYEFKTARLYNNEYIYINFYISSKDNLSIPNVNVLKVDTFNSNNPVFVTDNLYTHGEPISFNTIITGTKQTASLLLYWIQTLFLQFIIDNSDINAFKNKHLMLINETHKYNIKHTPPIISGTYQDQLYMLQSIQPIFNDFITPDLKFIIRGENFYNRIIYMLYVFSKKGFFHSFNYNYTCFDFNTNSFNTILDTDTTTTNYIDFKNNQLVVSDFSLEKWDWNDLNPHLYIISNKQFILQNVYSNSLTAVLLVCKEWQTNRINIAHTINELVDGSSLSPTDYNKYVYNQNTNIINQVVISTQPNSVCILKDEQSEKYAAILPI